jgi:hypothetical protein
MVVRALFYPCNSQTKTRQSPVPVAGSLEGPTSHRRDLGRPTRFRAIVDARAVNKKDTYLKNAESGVGGRETVKGWSWMGNKVARVTVENFSCLSLIRHVLYT